MRVLLCWFSGTGNTKKIVDEYVAVFREKGVECTLCNIEKAERRDPSEYDILGIAYPVWGFNAPGIVLDYVKGFAKQKSGSRAFILKTSGEALALNNASSGKLRRLLKKRGFELTNEYHYLMPYNIIFRHTDGMANRMWTAVKDTLPIDCNAILGGKTELLKSVPFGRPITAVLRIQQWGGRFNGKRYKVTDDCVHCGKCVAACPTQNITDDGGLVFGKKCLMCMRCAFFCPKNAIRIGLFDGWRVNGEYSFDRPYADGENDVGTDEKHRDYCRKSYEKYFAACDRKKTESENK